MANKWKQLTEEPTGRESVESNTYKVEWIKNIIEHAEKSGYEEMTFKIYDNGNIAFSFETEEIEFTENAEEFNER